MKDKYELTILTATYNREGTLTRLYESLCSQTRKGFQWLIIDDGSTDGTKELVKGFGDNGFEIEYQRKSNGGKHTALNFSHPYIKGKLVIIVDSDDFLLPEAVEVICEDWKRFQERQDVGGLSYFRCDKNGKPYSSAAKEYYYIDNDISYRVNHFITGDRCEVVRTDVFTQYPFPVFENETFMSEGWFWRKMALKYLTVYVNRSLYICEYLEGGLTKSGRSMRMKNPLGMMENCRSFFVSACKTKGTV